MSEEEQNAVVGRVLTRKRNLEKRVALLEQEAKRYGEILVQVGSGLRVRPEDVFFLGQSTPAPVRDAPVDPALIDGAKAAALVLELRTVRAELAAVRREAAQIGF
jgi:hypothetical protein